MDMDWEPEVPGQWNTPLRTRRLRAATEAAFSNTLSHKENPVTKDYTIDWEPEIPGQFDTPLHIRRKRAAAEAGFSETVLNTGFCIPNVTVKSIILENSYFAPIANILAYTFRFFHQIYSATIRGARVTGNTASAVAGSRQVIEIRRTAANGFESVKRRVIDSGITRPVAPTAQQIIRNKRPVAQPKPLRSPHRKSGTYQMAPLAEPSLERVSPPLSASIEQIPAHPEASLKQIAPLMEAQISSPKLQALEPPIDREALGAKLWANFTPRPIPGARGLLAISQQSSPISPVDGQPSLPSNIETTSMKSFIEKSTSKKFQDAMSFKSAKIKPSLKNNLVDHGPRRTSSDTNTGSYTIEKRPSLPELSTSAKYESITRSNTISATPKTVHFAMNETNGLPQEYSVRFYKDSKIGEWAPSSPWIDDQVLACTSDLKYNLEALLREDSWLPPPSTPVKRVEPCYLGGDSSSILEENLPSSPPGTESRPQTSPNSISDPSSTSADILDVDQPLPDQQLEDESPIVQARTTSSIPESPYTRIKELVKGSFRKVFSPSTRVTPSDAINSNPAQEVMNVSIEDHDTHSQMAELNHLPSLLDLPIPEIGQGSRDRHLSGFNDSPIAIDLHDGSQEFNKCSSGSGESANPHDIPQDKEDLANTTLEDAMFNLKMSNHSKKKLEEKRKKKEAARRAAEEAAAAKAKAEAEEAERKARSHRRIPKEKLVKPLSEHWEGKIKEAMGKGQGAVLTTTVSGTELRGKDFLTVLGERQWLNDEIINAYLEWVVDYANKKAGKDGRNAIPKVVAQNSFFYKNLSEDGPKKVSRWMTRKKAGGKKLLEVETVLIPVNNANHWTIIVVSPKERTIEYLDSFSGASKVFINNTKIWLKEELGNDWRDEEWRVLDTRSAEQLNGYDCGVFLLTNAECVSGGLTTDSYDFRDMADQRRRIAAILLNRGFKEGNEFVPAEEL